MRHPNIERLQASLDAYAMRNVEALSAALAPDAIWHVGGKHRFSGDYRGREAILRYFEAVGRETGETLQLTPHELLANDQRGAVFLKVTAQREGKQLDTTMAEAFVFASDGTIAEFWAHAADQDAIDSFWA